MIYFILSFIGVFIYSATQKKRQWFIPLLFYSWRKFTEKVLQVPSEMAKGFATHPIASLFIIGVGLGFCVITRNCEGMSLLSKLTLNDMFSVIALPSFLENLPWWQGPTNQEYTKKYLIFYVIHLFFLRKQSFFWDMVEVALITCYFGFFLQRWIALTKASKTNYLNNKSAVEMVVLAKCGKNDLFVTYHRIKRAREQEHDRDDEQDYNNTGEDQNNELPNLNYNLQRDAVTEFTQYGGRLACWSVNPIKQLFNIQISTRLQKMYYDKCGGMVICVFYFSKYYIQIYSLDSQKKQFKLINSYWLEEECTLMSLCIELQSFIVYNKNQKIIQLNNIYSIQYSNNINNLNTDNTDGINNTTSINDTSSSSKVVEPLFNIPLSLSSPHIKLNKLTKYCEGYTIIFSSALSSVSVYQIQFESLKESTTSKKENIKVLTFEQPCKEVLDKPGINKIIFQGEDGLFSIYCRDRIELLYSFNLFDGAVIDMIDNNYFAIQAFTKLFIMKNYSSPKYIQYLDYFRNIDFTLIFKKDRVLFIHSSLYNQKSQFQLNISQQIYMSQAQESLKSQSIKNKKIFNDKKIL